MFEATEIKSQITNESAAKRLRQKPAYLRRFGNIAGEMIGIAWDGCNKLKFDQFIICSKALAKLLIKVNQAVQERKFRDIQSLNHSDIRLIWSASGDLRLALDLNMNGVILPMVSSILRGSDNIFTQKDGITSFVDDIVCCLACAIEIRDACRKRDREMHECMTEAALRWGNPDLAVWLRIVPQAARFIARPRWDKVRYEFCIETIADTLVPGLACAAVETATQMSGILQVFERLDHNRRQQKSWLAANGAIGAIDSLTYALLARHGMDPATAYIRCQEFHCTTGEPLVIHQTKAALHSIFIENGVLRCNVQNQMLSIHGQFLTLGVDLPATLIAGAAGRLIGDLIENETLTASKARVVSASRLYKKTAFELEIGESLIFA